MTAPIRRAAAAVAAVAVLLLVEACGRVVPGSAHPSPPAVTAGLAAPERGLTAHRGPAGQAAAATAEALQEFWREEFPAAFGRQWRDITTFAAVATDDPDATPPPCINRAGDLADQAFYCPSADAVAWDADGLIPLLHDRFGPAGVVVVLAHEVGHAVQTRLGLDAAQERTPQRYPTILLEAMADCYAGVALAHLVEHPVAGLPMGLAERDEAMRALVGFRDPLGVASGDRNAHGNAFDRVSAFQDGYTEGAALCADMDLANRTFTQRRFGSEADLARGGDLPLRELLAFVESDARAWFSGLAAGWQPPPLSTGAECAADELAVQGPVAYCPDDGAVAVDLDALERLHHDVGDFAGATVVAGRYGLALLDAVGEPPVGRPAGAAATCLAGAYTGGLLDSGDAFRLSPGDLDEAVQVLLRADWAARDAEGASDPAEHGFERVARFRAGLLEGPATCLPAG
ncbi:MAG TPA: neutral zinc metallopeptidase [Pseudonocardia sp.]|nr:neutral zinc metallopeptidase [Pseudonocardia sp.]